MRVRTEERRALTRYAHVVNANGNGRVLARRRLVLFAPERCSKCQSREVFADRSEPRRLACFSCGEDWFVLGVPP